MHLKCTKEANSPQSQVFQNPALISVNHPTISKLDGKKIKAATPTSELKNNLICAV